MTRALVIGVSVGAIYGMLALGITLVYKTTRVLNFGLAEMGTFATYLTWQAVVRWHWPWVAGAPLAVLIVTLIGLAFERFVVRPNIDASRVSLLIATVGLSFLLFGLELGFWGPSPQLLPSPFRGSGPEILGVFVQPLRLFALGTTAVVGIGLMLLLKRTTFGLGVLAAAHDPITIRLMGVRLSRISMFAWGTSAALAAVTGIVLSPAVGTFFPFSLTFFFPRALAAALLGGLTSLPGAFVGGVAIGVLEASLQQAFPSTSGIVEAGLFAVVLSVLLLRPQGLLGKAA
ncbi:MAG: branched-chain amino acid ABC transporter permease [Actinomycetota bacterium]